MMDSLSRGNFFAYEERRLIRLINAGSDDLRHLSAGLSDEDIKTGMLFPEEISNIITLYLGTNNAHLFNKAGNFVQNLCIAPFRNDNQKNWLVYQKDLYNLHKIITENQIASVAHRALNESASEFKRHNIH